MMVLKAVLLASLIFSSLAMGDDPVTPECELNNQPLTENPLAGIAPSCLVQRPMSTTPQEYFQNDQRVCDCIDRSPLTSLITPRSTTSDTTEVEEGDVFVNEEIIASEIPPSRVNDQCITFMEFSSHREMPRENEFFTTIPTGTFNPSDWRAEDLIRQYDTAPANARPGIEERLRFLHRNSQIEALMSAETGPAFPDAREKQIELFNLLKTLSPPSGSNCSSTPNGCLEEIQRSGAYNNFRQSLANLMNDPVLANKIEDASDARILRLVRQDERNVERGQFPLNTVEDLYAFMNIASPELIGNCAGPEADAECYENFPVYCRGLRTVATNIERNQSLPGVSVDNRILIENNMNTWTEGFERFNTQICNTPHQNSAGQSLTFFQYKNQQCPANQSTTPLCSDRQQLVSQYLAAFPGPDDSEAYNRFSFGFYLHKDPVSVAAEASLFLGNRSVMAKESSQRFSQQLNSPTIPKATMQGLITAAKVSSSTTSRSSTTSSASLSPEINAPLNPIGSTSGSANSRFQNNRNDNPFPNSNSDTFRSSALRDLTRPIDYNEFSDEPAPFPLRRPEERRVNNNQIADGNSQQTPIPQRPELSQPQFSGGQTQTAPSSGPGNRRAISGGGGGSGVSSSAPDAPQVSSSGGRRSIIEVSPRRGSGSRSGRSPASTNDDQSNTGNSDIRPVIPVEVNQAILTSALTDPQILANDQSIMERVNSSPEQVVRLALRVAGSNDDTVVYAIKENGGVRFSLTPPSETVPANAQILRPNEMNLRVVDQTSFTDISRDPASLLANTELISTARTIEGGIVRMNIISPTGQTSVIYLDKRTDQLRILTRAPR